MRIGISWNEFEKKYYVTIGDITKDGYMQSFKKKEEIPHYCSNASKKFPGETIDLHLSVLDCEKQNIEKLMQPVIEAKMKNA